MKTRLHIILLLFQAAASSLYAQCGYLAGKITDISGAMPLVASVSAKTDQGKQRLGKSDSLGAFNVEMPCQISELTIECPQYQTQHIPVNIDGKTEGTFFISLAMMPLGKQTSDEPYAQSEQKHFELKDSLKAVSIVRRIEVRDAVSDQRLAAEICLYYTQKQKKDCFALTTDRPRAEIVFTEKDIVAIEVKSIGYQSYNGNLILDKTDEEPRTYIIKLNRQRTILSVNVLQAQQGMLCRLWSDGQSDIALNRVNEGHYFAELVPGRSYKFGIAPTPGAPELVTAMASVKEGITLKTLRMAERIPERTAPPVTSVATPAARGITASDKTLYFPRSDYKLPVQSRTYLDSVAIYILENKNKGLRITGHTDNVGNPGLNLTLSEYRVRVISRYLIGKGVPESAIAAVGVGSKFPVRPNDSEENRRMNRRVEVQIIDLDSKSN
ncbi:OmpA family protein [Dyadobacter sp. 50-39]|uniref:OmpA family protein n=1 Tax=Dyadobacter sp. 50-39 TaxID=1895756 RepID=UPI000A8CB5FE|nr:OmpA family protein [Dyadobacter sp. 50-39]